MADIFDLIASINALLPEGTAVRIGAEHVSEHSSSTARVLWVPMPDGFTAPPNRGWSARRPILTLTSKWSVFCWGKGDDKVDTFASMRATAALRDELLGAVHVVARGDYQVLGGQFEAQDGSTILQSGRLYILQIGFTTAVLERERLVLAPMKSAASTVDLPPENGSRIVVDATEIP